MSTKNEAEIKRVIQVHGNLLYRTALVILGNPHDTQDVLQEVLLKYMEKSPDFRDENHEKAWLLKVTANLCRDFLRFNKRHAYVSIDELETICSQPRQQETLKEVFNLPPKFKTVLLLHYVEGYQLKEIAEILSISENAVKKRLQRGKEALKQRIKE